MCYKPISMVTPSKKISLYGGQQIKLQFGCGKCYQCLQAKQLEFHYRTYYECEDCLNNGGYVMAITLTYRPADVPRLSKLVNIDLKEFDIPDFMCFNFKHYQNFLKLLRIRLSRSDKWKNVIVRYFLSSEYGTDPKGTHRPHYHLLLFVNCKDIHPYQLSKLVSDCWIYGRTDGVPYKPMSYVRKYTFGFYGNDDNRKQSLLRVCNYVSKYVTKCSEFQKIIENRLTLLRNLLVYDVNDGLPMPVFTDDDLKILSRDMTMFHRQSQGYGLGYLTNIQDDELKYLRENTKMRIPSSDTVVSSIPLPLYYIRKLYYKCIQTNTFKDGELVKSYRWQLTEEGVQWRTKYILKNIETQCNKYEEYLANMPGTHRDLIHYYLNGRELIDFIIYKSLYKNRLKYNDYALNSLSTEKLVQFLVEKNNVIDDNSINKFNIPFCNPRFFVTASNTPNYYEDIKHYTDVSWMVRSLPFEAIDDFIDNNVYNENSDVQFTDFDKIDDLFNLYIVEYGNKKQDTYDSIENLKKRFKYIYNAETQVINL